MIWNDGTNGWAMAFMMISALLSWAVVIAAVVYLIRDHSHRQPQRSASSKDYPQQILAERFARGEIDEDEYLSRTAALSGGQYQVR